MNWKERYNAAHFEWTKCNCPNVVADGFYSAPVLPKVNTANGLNKFIENYIGFIGGRATRINVVGMMRGGRRVHSTTRKGSADISSTLPPHGRSCQWETKIGRDKPSEHQLKEQAKERAAGGEYFFVSTPEQFFEYLDEFLSRK
jgi:hypothetical protein